MAEPVWGQLAKAQDDNETIEEALVRLIAEHETNAGAHTGAGEALETHKTQVIVDHPAGSIVEDKLPDNVITTPKINDLAVTEGKIGNLAVTNAKINDLNADKITAGTITSKAITLAISAGQGDVKIQAGKTDFGDNTAGFILGIDDSDGDKAKFEIGNATDYIKWDGEQIEMLCSSENAIHIQYGSDILLSEGGDIKFTSVTAPTACTGALSGVAGNVNNGDHYYKVTFVNEAGETELGAVSNLVTVTDKTVNGQINLTNIPISASGSVTKRQIYRTNAGSPYYYLVATINDNTTTTHTDNIADTTPVFPYANDLVNSSFGKLFVDGVASLELSASNVFIGQDCGLSNTTGDSNTAVGYKSLYSNTTGIGNTSLGYHSLYSNIRSGTNIAVGYKSLYSNTTGDSNTSVGSFSLYSNTSGHRNTATGIYSLYGNTNGDDNCAYGNFASRKNTTGNKNCAYGYYSLWNNSGGNYNTGYGTYSLYNVSGSNNVALGYYAGKYETGSNAFYVNNQNRTNTAGDKAKSLMYGVMAAAAADQKLTINALLNLSVSKTPASSGAAGVAGDIAWDTSYIYVCTATDTWKRTAIASW